jgi:hypothetical protein
MSRADVSRELSIDEILKKIERGIAGGHQRPYGAVRARKAIPATGQRPPLNSAIGDR